MVLCFIVLITIGIYFAIRGAKTAAGSEETQPIKAVLKELGAVGSMMTGSGAAVFGIFDSEEKAKAACEYFRGKVRSVFIAKPVNFGATVARNKPPRRK